MLFGGFPLTNPPVSPILSLVKGFEGKEYPFPSVLQRAARLVKGLRRSAAKWSRSREAELDVSPAVPRVKGSSVPSGKFGWYHGYAMSAPSQVSARGGFLHAHPGKLPCQTQRGPEQVLVLNAV